jgi:hypothetical protein
MANRTKVTAAMKRRFVAALGECGVVRRACLAVGIAPKTAYAHRKADPAFAAEWDVAAEMGIDALLDEAKGRVLAGTGSDRLAIFLLSSTLPSPLRKPPEARHPSGATGRAGAGSGRGEARGGGPSCSPCRWTPGRSGPGWSRSPPRSGGGWRGGAPWSSSPVPSWRRAGAPLPPRCAPWGWLTRRASRAITGY